MIRRTMLALAAGLAVAGTAAAQTTPKTSPANPPTQPVPIMTDTQFLDKAIVANHFEIETGRLAQGKATDPKLKQFASMMVSDHGMALAELQQISKGLNRPAPDKLDSVHQAKLESLKSKDGAGFDTAYKAEMKAGHADVLMMLESHRKTAVDEKVKAWIEKTIPVVQKHKTMIDGM